MLLNICFVKKGNDSLVPELLHDQYKTGTGQAELMFVLYKQITFYNTEYFFFFIEIITFYFNLNRFR